MNSKYLLLIAGLVLMAAPAWAQNSGEGKKLYDSYCSTCHGDKGKGNGPAAQSLPAKPADHTNGAVMNVMSEQFLLDIISKGGSAVKKSSFMPSWGSALNEKQIKDIVAYIRTLAEPPYKPEANAKTGAK
ncbi:MAG: cytochrome c [Deltaproteobacteria bacterium]|nr:cytochrome c [Deltaproteobacteria bacterium]